MNSFTHTGSGDNVAGSKYVSIISTTPENFHSLVFEVKQQVLERRFDQARVTIQTLKKIHNLNAEAERLVESLDLYLNIREHKTLDDRRKLARLLKTSDDNLTKDILNSTRVYLSVETHGEEPAETFFPRNKNLGPFSQELFLELFANEKQLRAFFSESVCLDISEYISLMRGAERLNATSLMHEIAGKLDDDYRGDFLSQKYLLIAKIASVNEKIPVEGHYWLASAEIKTEISNIALELSTLIDLSEGQYGELFEIADSILRYCLGYLPELFDTLWKHIKEFEKVSPQSASRIRAEKERHYSGTLNNDVDIEKLEQFRRDNHYKEQFLSKLASSSEITENDFFIALQSLDTLDYLNKWVEKGGLLKTEEQFVNDFLQLERQVASVEKLDTKKLDLESLLDAFLKLHFADVKRINIVRLNDLCERLNYLEFPNYTVRFLEVFISNKRSLWPSPVVKTYLIGLLNSSKLKTLRETLTSIPRALYDADSFRLESFLEYLSGNSKKAFQAITQSLTIFPDDIVSWAHMFVIADNSKATFKLNGWLEKIPEHFFKEYSETGLKVLIGIAKHSSFKKVESTLLNWFIASPNELAIPITQIFLGDLEPETEIVNLSDEVNGTIGVSYFNGKDLVTKLLVGDNFSIKNDYCIKRSSLLGKVLLNLEPGDTTTFNLKEITLKSFDPPLLSANHISLRLRDINNDGSDCFYSFQLPDDPHEMKKKFAKVLEQLQSPKKHYDSIPSFIIRGKISQREDPVKGALEQLVDDAEKISPFSAIGEVSPKNVLLDIYAICYLSITGLWKGLDKIKTDFCITEPTKEIMTAFIRKKAAMQASAIDGELFVQSEEEVQHRLSVLKEAFQTIINSSSMIELKEFDVPDKLFKIKELIDSSVFSTICVSSEKNIPWLCIDSEFSLMAGEFDCQIVNTFELFYRIGQQLKVEVKIPGLLLNAQKSLPYVLTPKEIIDLASSKNYDELHVLSLLLVKHTNPFKDFGEALNFFTYIVGKFLFDGEEISHNHPLIFDDFERSFNGCCRSILSSSPEIKAEEKLAGFVWELLILIKGFPEYRQVIFTFATNFAEGHFLDIESINTFLKNKTK